MSTSRTYPNLEPLADQQIYPVSFVTVHFCNDLEHNLLRSEAVKDPRNQLIVVDNRSNVFHENLGRAMNHGLEQAVHDLIVVIHEDVLLPDNWQQHFSRAVDALEQQGLNWGLLGAVGWTHATEGGANGLVGHWSDPRQCSNTLQQELYQQVERIDEQIMVLRRSNGIVFDPDLPTIHNIGIDMPRTLKRKGLPTYIINAPTIHKYAGEDGVPIQTTAESPKIVDRENLAYKADKSLSDEYMQQKWDENPPPPVSPPARPASLDLPPPVILVAKGGGGSRLISQLAMDVGIFLGNDVNISGDAMEMVRPMYRGVLRHFQESQQAQRWRTVHEIAWAAKAMWEKKGGPAQWGFKLPEAVFLLPELLQAFPEAKFLHMVRDPLVTCLRRTHMTGRLDNQIGRTTVPAAYRAIGRPLEQALSDSDGIRMACTTRHQLELIWETLANLEDSDRVFEVRFEDMIDKPGEAVDSVAEWLGLEVVGSSLRDSVDPNRAKPDLQQYSPEDIEVMEELLAPVRQRFGYLPNARAGLLKRVLDPVRNALFRRDA